jgi:MscS family membrane protein
MRLLLALSAALALLLAAPRAPAQPLPAPAAQHAAPAAPPGAPEQVAPDSPRASMTRFLDLCRAGEYADAASYLDLSDAQKPEGAQLARRLKAVLDRRIWIKAETLSPRPLGDPNDNLPAGVEELGAVPGPNGPEPVRIVRRHFPDGARWIFTRTTVDHVDGWYRRLPDRWEEELIPERLMRPGPRDLLYWQWIALPVLFALALGAGRLLGWATRRLIARFARGDEHADDHAMLDRLSAPLTLVWAVLAVDLALPWLALYPPAEAFIERLVRAALFVAVLWFATRSIDVGALRALARPGTGANPAARSLLPLGAKAAKVTLLVIAAIAALSELGYPVGSLVAGLGIGGVALALAAQKTVENLFGSLAIGVDQPFRVGDYITVDGLSGTVESIGLRSTRLRTLDRTLVTMPNGKLADMRIESYAHRDRIKFGFTLGLPRDTSAATLRAVIAGVRARLAAAPKIWPDVGVSLAKIGDATIDVEILAWFETKSWDEFTKLREEALLGILEEVEKAGARLVSPAAPPPPPPPARPS